MPASQRAAAVMLYAQATFLFLVAVLMVSLIFQPPIGGTKAIAATAFTIAYIAALCIVAFRLARGRRHARPLALALQLLPSTAAFYLISAGLWFGWFTAAYCLILMVFLAPRPNPSRLIAAGHITRAEEALAGSRTPISPAEWAALVSAIDAIQPANNIAGPSDQAFVYVYVCPDGTTFYLWWQDEPTGGDIAFAPPRRRWPDPARPASSTGSLLALAEHLDAQVIGKSGERYSRNGVSRA